MYVSRAKQELLQMHVVEFGWAVLGKQQDQPSGLTSKRACMQNEHMEFLGILLCSSLSHKEANELF